MFIPLSEIDTEYRPGGEERNNFQFYRRNPKLPVEVKITRLPPSFDFNNNWHRHQFIEEFSVPLRGEILIKNEEGGKSSERHIKDAILSANEWVVGIECISSRRVTLLIEAKNGKRRQEVVAFKPEYTEGKNWHTVGNPTKDLVVMLTLKRVPPSVVKKDPFVFEVDREIKRL